MLVELLALELAAVSSAQKRTGVPSPSTKLLPSAESRTKPLSPATFSFSERRSSRALSA